MNKGYSYESMADELDISTSAYRKIELHETKLTLERLYQISETLNTKVGKLMGINPKKRYKQDIGEKGFGYQDIKHLHAENEKSYEKLIEQYEKRLGEKEEIIQLLKNNQ